LIIVGQVEGLDNIQQQRLQQTNLTFTLSPGSRGGFRGRTRYSYSGRCTENDGCALIVRRSTRLCSSKNEKMARMISTDARDGLGKLTSYIGVPLVRMLFMILTYCQAYLHCSSMYQEQRLHLAGDLKAESS